MTKTEAREYLRRCREGIRTAEKALRENNEGLLAAAVQEIGGCAGTIESAMDDYGSGIRGIVPPGPYYGGG